MFINIKKIVFVFFLILFAVPNFVVYAANCNCPDGTKQPEPVGGTCGTQAGGGCYGHTASQGGGGGNNVNQAQIPGISKKGLDQVLIDIIKYLTVILAGLFVLMVIVGGIMMMTMSAAGKQEEGRKTVQWAVVGAVICLLAYSIVKVLESILT